MQVSAGSGRRSGRARWRSRGDADAVGSKVSALYHLHCRPLYTRHGRNGYLYVIHLLIAHNADPTIADSQGYNTLHLVTHSSAIMPLLYLLHQPIAVDSLDAQGALSHSMSIARINYSLQVTHLSCGPPTRGTPSPLSFSSNTAPPSPFGTMQVSPLSTGQSSEATRHVSPRPSPPYSSNPCLAHLRYASANSSRRVRTLTRGTRLARRRAIWLWNLSPLGRGGARLRREVGLKTGDDAGSRSMNVIRELPFSSFLLSSYT